MWIRSCGCGRWCGRVASRRCRPSSARSASDGSWPSSRRSVSRAASSSRLTRRTPRGQASRRSASIIAPRMRRSANVSNLMPRLSSNRWAASINPMTPSCTRSPTSIEWGIVDAMRRASASTKGSPLTTRRLWAAGIGWARISFLAPERPECPATSPCIASGVPISTQRKTET